ncbi:MAG: hypothetical protein QM811_12555 [Pirellulales bacterium]
MTPETLSPEATEFYAGRMQNLLVNRCTTAGCHETKGKSDFKLERFSHLEPIPRSTTQKNLRATLRYVRTDRPEESPLARMALTAHGGGLDSPLQAGETSAVATLRTWLQTLTPTRPLPPIAAPTAMSASTLPAAPAIPPLSANAAPPSTAGVSLLPNAGGPMQSSDVEALSREAVGPSIGGTPPPQDVSPGWKSAVEREKRLRDAEARVNALRDDTKPSQTHGPLNTDPLKAFGESKNAEARQVPTAGAAPLNLPSKNPTHPDTAPKFGVPGELPEQPTATQRPRASIPGIPKPTGRSPYAVGGPLKPGEDAKVSSSVPNATQPIVPPKPATPLVVPTPQPKADAYDASLFDPPR